MRPARALPYAFGVALLLAAAPAGLAQDTAENDPGFLERIIQSALGGEGRDVQIRGLAGPLSGEPRIAEITVADSDGVWLTIRDVVLNWRRLAVFRRQLDVNSLTIGEIVVARAPLPAPTALPSPEAVDPEAEPEEAPGGFALPELPVSVEIQEVAIGAVRLGEPLIGQAADLSVDGSAQMADGEADLTLQLVRLDGTEGRFDLQAGFSNTTRVLRAYLDVREADGGLIATLARIPETPSLALSVSGEDPISDFEATLALSTADVQRLAGTVRLTESPAPTTDVTAAPVTQQVIDAQLGGDVTALFIPEYKPFFGDSVAFDLRATRTPDVGISVETLNLTAAALDLTGSFDLTADFAPRLIDVSGTIATPLKLPVVLPLPGPATLIDRADIEISFDAAQGDALVVSANVRNLQRDDGILLDAMELRADGTIVLTEGNGIASASAEIDADLSGLSVTDPKLFEAAGDSATLTAQVDWASEGRLDVRDLDLRSDQVQLTGGAQVTGLAEEAAPEVALDANLTSGPLSRFATLAATPLTGSVVTSLSGNYAVQTGAFNVTVDGTGQGLGIGPPEADALLAGPLTLGVTAARGAEGITVERLALSNDALTLSGGGRLASDSGDMQVNAEIADLSVLEVAQLSGPVTLSAELNGVDDVWDASLDVASDDASVTGQGTIENLFGGDISVTADAEIDTGDLARIAPLVDMPLTGRVTLDASGSYDVASGNGALTADGIGMGLSIGQPQADALMSSPLSLAVTAARDGDTISVDRLYLRGTAINVTGGGQIEGDGGTMSLDAELPELALLEIPSLSGPVSLKADLEGEDDLWNANVNLVSNEATVVGNAQVDKLMAGEIDASGSARIETGRLSRFAPLVGMPLTGQIGLDANGRYNAVSGDAALTANGSGSGLSVGIEQADALLAGALTLAVDASRTDGDIQIQTARLQTNQVALNAEGGMTDGAGRFDLTFGLNDLASLLEGLSGPLDLRAAIEGQEQTWDVAGNLTGPNGISAVISGGAIRPDGTVDLSVTGDVPLLIAEPFIAPRTLVGDAAFDITVQGQPGLEAVRGTVTIADARASDPGTRMVVEGINLNVGLANSTANVDLSGQLRTGGTITVSGPVALTAPFDAGITVALQELTVIDPTLYEVNMSGNASIQGPLLGGAAVTAGVVIDRAEIRIPSGLGGPGAVPDITHTDEPATSLETRRRAGIQVDPPDETDRGAAGPVYDLDITIAAPRQVFVRGRGLDVEMGGGITVGGTTAAPIPGGGIRLLRGQMALLGQRLEFEKAEINLQGNLVPDLDMVAFSNNGSVRAFIEIQGPVTAPQLSFRSQPQLPEDEVLAQLFFGKPINELTPLEVAQLLASVNRLTGNGGPGVLSRLQQSIGVDSLGVTTDDDGETEVSAGKYLSERLYTDVTVGASGTSEIELNYDFNSTFKGRTAVDSEGDSSVGFAFERDF